jgi:hypothetical protein
MVTMSAMIEAYPNTPDPEPFPGQMTAISGTSQRMIMIVDIAIVRKKLKKF